LPTSEKASSTATASPSGKRPIIVDMTTSPITMHWQDVTHKRKRPS
jgi:hypothetical protein